MRAIRLAAEIADLAEQMAEAIALGADEGGLGEAGRAELLMIGESAGEITARACLAIERLASISRSR